MVGTALGIAPPPQILLGTNNGRLNLLEKLLISLSAYVFLKLVLHYSQVRTISREINFPFSFFLFFKISSVLLLRFLLCTLLSSPKEGNFFINQDSDSSVIALLSCRDRMLQWPKGQLRTEPAVNPTAMLSSERRPPVDTAASIQERKPAETDGGAPLTLTVQCCPFWGPPRCVPSEVSHASHTLFRRCPEQNQKHPR